MPIILFGPPFLELLDGVYVGGCLPLLDDGVGLSGGVMLGGAGIKTKAGPKVSD